MQDYRDLIVWQRSMELVKEIYRLVKALPSEEKFALSDQISVALNICDEISKMINSIIKKIK